MFPDFDFFKRHWKSGFLYVFLIWKCCQFIPVKEKTTKNNKQKYTLCGPRKTRLEVGFGSQAINLLPLLFFFFFFNVYTLTQNTVIAIMPTASVFILITMFQMLAEAFDIHQLIVLTIQ